MPSDETALDIQRVLPRTGAGTLTTAEAHAVLKIALLASEADDEVADEEDAAFKSVAKGIQSLGPAGDPGMSDKALDDALEAFGERLDEHGREALWGELRAALDRMLSREIAYKVAVAMTLSDLDRGGDEDDFEDELIEALGLTEEQADTLSSDVYAALDEGE